METHTINFKKKNHINIRLAVFILIVLLIPVRVSSAQSGISLPEYIETYRTVAMQEMRRYGIPASIKLAQGILESNFGNSELAVNANNHFGIKCHGWAGRGYRYTDDAPNECFRHYRDPFESFLDHSQFLLSRPWYRFLFDLDPLDYTAWAHGLRKAGYATDPVYAFKLIRIIEEYNLNRFDRWAIDITAELPDYHSPIKVDSLDNDVGGMPVISKPVSSGLRTISTNNRIKYVVARQGDTPESLAAELSLRSWQIVRYNELGDFRSIVPGQMIYLQPKRNRGTRDFHIAGEGETMYLISQIHGIKVNRLYQRNNMRFGDLPQTGQKIFLRGRVR